MCDMYEDRTSIKVWDRQHARDRLVEQARHLQDETSDDVDMFVAHARAEGRGGLVVAGFVSILAILALVGALALFWK